VAYDKLAVAANRRKKQRIIYEYKLRHPCVDCGEADPIVLELDHRENKDPRLTTRKSFSLGGLGMNALLEELEKCDVRCANCHRRRTAEDRGYYDWIE